MKQVRVRIGEGGELVLPSEFCQHLQWNAGDEVIARLEEDEIRIFNLKEAIQLAQEFVRQHVPEGRSLVDELLAERRAEAARE